MTTQDTGLIVTITTERGDTLDLMRRNIDDLGRALSDLGYSDVSFAFDQDQSASENPDGKPGEDTPTGSNTAQDQPRKSASTNAPAIPPQIATTGIDMRL